MARLRTSCKPFAKIAIGARAKGTRAFVWASHPFMSASQAVPSSPSVLVVEDEKQLLEITSLRLASLGCEVHEASSGERALEIYREHGRHIDFVFTDLRMDGIGGIALIERLLEIDPEVRIVAVSALIDELDTVRNRWGGRVRMMLKPYNTEELQVLLRLEGA